MINPYRISEQTKERLFRINPRTRKTLVQLLEGTSKDVSGDLQEIIEQTSEEALEDILFFFSEIYKDSLFMGEAIQIEANRVLLWLAKDAKLAKELVPFILASVGSPNSSVAEMASSVLQTLSISPCMLVEAARSEVYSFFVDETACLRISRQMDLFYVLGKSALPLLRNRRFPDEHKKVCPLKRSAFRLFLSLADKKLFCDGLTQLAAILVLAEMDMLDQNAELLKHRQLWETSIKEEAFLIHFKKSFTALQSKKRHLPLILSLLKKGILLDDLFQETLSLEGDDELSATMFIEHSLYRKNSFLDEMFFGGSIAVSLGVEEKAMLVNRIIRETRNEALRCDFVDFLIRRKRWEYLPAVIAGSSHAFLGERVPILLENTLPIEVHAELLWLIKEHGLFPTLLSRFIRKGDVQRDAKTLALLSLSSDPQDTPFLLRSDEDLLPFIAAEKMSSLITEKARAIVLTCSDALFREVVSLLLLHPSRNNALSENVFSRLIETKDHKTAVLFLKQGDVSFYKKEVVSRLISMLVRAKDDTCEALYAILRKYNAEQCDDLIYAEIDSALPCIRQTPLSTEEMPLWIFGAVPSSRLVEEELPSLTCMATLLECIWEIRTENIEALIAVATLIHSLCEYSIHCRQIVSDEQLAAMKGGIENIIVCLQRSVASETGECGREDAHTHKTVDRLTRTEDAASALLVHAVLGDVPNKCLSRGPSVDVSSLHMQAAPDALRLAMQTDSLEMIEASVKTFYFKEEEIRRHRTLLRLAAERLLREGRATAFVLSLLAENRFLVTDSLAEKLRPLFTKHQGSLKCILYLMRCFRDSDMGEEARGVLSRLFFGYRSNAGGVFEAAFIDELCMSADKSSIDCGEIRRHVFGMEGKRLVWGLRALQDDTSKMLLQEETLQSIRDTPHRPELYALLAIVCRGGDARRDVKETLVLLLDQMEGIGRGPFETINALLAADTPVFFSDRECHIVDRDKTLVLAYYSLLPRFKGLFREVIGASGRHRWLYETTRTHFSPHLIDSELARLRAIKERLIDKTTSLALRKASGTTCIEIEYRIEEFAVSIEVGMPCGYPLDIVSITGGQRVGVTKRKWNGILLASQTIMSVSGMDICDALVLWKENMAAYFEGIEACTICYSVIDPHEKKTPETKCATCRNSFHNSCLYTWFKNAKARTCPLCRGVFTTKLDGTQA
eukprot:GHVN01033627.1.p1 GENE.GHVN01033627.1~~GHVN01033627.1.p1  ORF type:complete len:1188 (-),score=137.17 GHVN01033627.1:1137-4700(-)